jgi:hypothetical protein
MTVPFNVGQKNYIYGTATKQTLPKRIIAVSSTPNKPKKQPALGFVKQTA